MREICSSGTVRGGDGNVPTYSAPRPTAGGEFGDAIGSHRKVGDEAVVVGALSGVVADLDGEPIYRKGIVGGAQRYRR